MSKIRRAKERKKGQTVKDQACMHSKFFFSSLKHFQFQFNWIFFNYLIPHQHFGQSHIYRITKSQKEKFHRIWRAKNVILLKNVFWMWTRPKLLFVMVKKIENNMKWILMKWIWNGKRFIYIFLRMLCIFEGFFFHGMKVCFFSFFFLSMFASTNACINQCMTENEKLKNRFLLPRNNWNPNKPSIGFTIKINSINSKYCY